MLVALLGLFLYLDQTYSLEIPVSQLVVAQFTVVSLTLSIVALVANFNDRRIYGYRMSKAVFQSPHLDRLLFFVSIALTFLNLGLLVMKAQPVSVLCVFCTSIWIVSALVWRITRAVFDPGGVGNEVEAAYYRKALKQLKKGPPHRAER